MGAGKSSLLSALLGEMGRTGGVANVRGEVAFVAQQVDPPLTDPTTSFLSGLDQKSNSEGEHLV